MNASPPNENPHSPARLFCAFTGYITHPYVAWILFVLLMFCNLVVVWGLPQILEIATLSTRANVQFYPELLDSQAVIIGELEKALGTSRECR